MCLLHDGFPFVTRKPSHPQWPSSQGPNHLQQPGALVKQVAEEAGFTDPFHFSRVFTSVFGLSPTAFRGLR